MTGATCWPIGRCPKCGHMSAATNGREAWCWDDDCGYKWMLTIKRSTSRHDCDKCGGVPSDDGEACDECGQR